MLVVFEMVPGSRNEESDLLIVEKQ